MPDCVDCAAAAAATHQGVTVNGSGPPAASSSVGPASSMQVDMGPYTQRGPEYPQQGGGAKRERDGVESGYSTQNRDERDKERQGPGDQGAGDKKEKEKTNKTEQDQIQYIEGEGCQVWRPQVMWVSFYFLKIYSCIHEFLVDSFIIIIDHKLEATGSQNSENYI